MYEFYLIEIGELGELLLESGALLSEFGVLNKILAPLINTTRWQGAPQSSRKSYLRGYPHKILHREHRTEHRKTLHISL